MESKYLIAIALALVTFTGICLIFSLNPFRFAWRIISSGINRAKEAAVNRPKKATSLQDDLDAILGKNKYNFLEKAFENAKTALRKQGEADKIERTRRISIVAAIIGGVFALLLKNLLLVVPLGLICYFIPLWWVQIRAINYNAQVSDEIETALSIISSTYLRTNNIVEAIEENLPYLNDPVIGPFKRFCFEVNHVSPDITAGLRRLKRAFQNSVFEEWCDTVIACQSNSNIKATLNQTVRKLSMIKKVQQEYNTEMRSAMREHLTMVLIVVALIPTTAYVKPEIFDIIMHHPVGQILLAVLMVVVLICIDKAIQFTLPLDYGKKED